MNSRDYTDVYRLELWILGYLTSYTSQRQLRRSTLRSHVQIRWPDEDIPNIEELIQVVKLIEAQRNELWNESIPEMVKGYFADMNSIFETLERKMKGGSKAYIVVGNSSYANIPIDTDIFLAKIAETNHFKVEEIRIARYLRSSGQQDSQKIRESIIVLKKR